MAAELTMDAPARLRPLPIAAAFAAAMALGGLGGSVGYLTATWSRNCPVAAATAHVPASVPPVTVALGAPVHPG